MTKVGIVSDFQSAVLAPSSPRRDTGGLPAIAVVATVRNERSTIEPFIDSLLGQSYAPTEIVIVDGESTDGTLELLEARRAAGQIKLISCRCNIAEGRNIGIAATGTDHIAVTDAGCHVDGDWLHQIALAFSVTPPPDVVAGNFRFECRNAFEEAVVAATFQPDRSSRPVARYFPSARSAAFTRKAWESAGGYPEWLYAAEDTLFNVRLRQLGMQFVFCEGAVVSWRPRETWRALAKQRFNFARGNARIGFNLVGYQTNLIFHFAILLPLAATPWWPAAPLLSALAAVAHIRRHLWYQARIAAERSGRPGMRWRVLAVMEFVRLVNTCGYLAGRYDRLSDPHFVTAQTKWMGVDSVDALPAFPDDSDDLNLRTGDLG